MATEDLLIALLKSNQSHTKLRKVTYDNTEIGETKKLFNKLRNKFSKDEIMKIRKKIYVKEDNEEY